MPTKLQGAAANYLRGIFGGELSIAESTTSIGTSAESLIGNDPDRLMITIVNLSGNSGYVGFNREVSSTRGILLSANGGSITLNARDDGMLVTREVFALAAGSGSSFYIVASRMFTPVITNGGITNAD